MSRFAPASFAAPLALALGLIVISAPASAVQFDGAAVRLGIAQGSVDMPSNPDPRDFIPENGPIGDFSSEDMQSDTGSPAQMGMNEEEDEGPFDHLDQEPNERGAPVMLVPSSQHAVDAFFDV